MYAKKFMRAVAIAAVTLFSLLVVGLPSAGAFSVDVDNLTYSDDSGRSVEYDFTSGTVGAPLPNAIMLEGAATISKPGGEINSAYFWGSAPIGGLPAVTVTKNTGSATIAPSESKGVAVLFAGSVTPGVAPVFPAQTLPTNWFQTVRLSNFTGIEDQKAYLFSIGLGRDETAGPFNNASIQVLWVKGYYNGNAYPVATLIIQARVENSDNTVWQSVPIMRTDVSPATATLIFDLGVESGNHFTAGVNINGGDTQNLGDKDGNGCTLTTEQGLFQRFPDLYPYIYMEEESASTVPQPTVQSQHWKDSSGNDVYHAGLYVADPLHLASAIQVTGYNGVNVSLYYDVNAKSWYNTTPVVIGNLPVVSPSWPSYTFSFTPQDGGAAIPQVTKTITGYVTEFATNLLPSGSIPTTPVFSWTAAQGTISGYGIEMSDVSTGNRVWSLYSIPPTQTSVPYVGPALETGKSYRYNIVTQIEQGEAWNSSFAEGSFTYTGTTPTTISFAGNVMTAPNWPATDVMLPVADATVNALEVVFPLAQGNSYGQTATNETGAFLLGGIPAATTFRLTIPTPTGTAYVPVLSKFMNWNADIPGLLPFVLFTPTQYGGFGNATGTGMILGRVALESSPASFLAGATITAQAWTPPVYPATTPTLGAFYPVSYTGGGTSTGADGLFMVKNVPTGTLVQLVATLTDHTFTFNGSVVPVQADSVSEDSFFATPVSGSGGTFAGEAAFMTAFPGATLIDFNAINTASGHVVFTGTEYASEGITFASPNSQTLYVEPPPTSNWVWTSNYLSPGGAPFEGGDTNEDSLTLNFSAPVSAVGWKFLEIPNFSAIDIRLYDASNNLIHESLDGAGMVASATSDSAFWGYASATPIARVEITDTANNGDDVGFDDFRFAAATTPPAGISFAGLLYDSTNSGPIGGATIEMAGNASINATTNTTTGAFVLNGLPAGELFSVKMSPPVTLMGLVPTYTQAFQSTTPITAARTYNLYAATDLAAWGTATGTGVIRGRVMNSANLSAGYVSGAVVTYTSSLGNAGYRVMYENNIDGTLVSGGGTFPNGKFYILDVAPNDMVTVSATHSNYSILPTAFGHEAARTQAGSVYQGLLKGPAVSDRVGIGGYIMNTANPQVGIKNVVVGQAGVTSPVNATMSNTDGFFYLNVPQATPVQVKFEKPQDTLLAPTYSANMTFGSENLAIGDFNLFAITTLAGWTTTGKGIIRARVKDASGNYLAGATVTATSALHPATSYQICYDDACLTSKTETAADTGRYIVKNVDDGDTVTVTAHKNGYSFNTRIFPTHSDSMHQGSITGTYTGVVTQHPDAATIQTRFEAAMARFNDNDFTEATGFASFVSASFLDNGESKAMFVSGAQQDRAENGPSSWTVLSISGTGDYAAANITWGNGESDTLYFHKEGDLWMLYGNQKQFDVWANSGHQMYASSPYPYWVSFSVEDPDSGTGLTIGSVNVTGPGIESGINLYHNTGSGRWQSWGVSPYDPNLNPVWAAQPTTPLVYTFTINYTGGTLTSPEVQSITVESFVNVAPAQGSLSPASGATATRPLTFSWESVGAGYRYGVEVNDATGNRIWSSYDITGTSVVYYGPELGGGQYSYTVSTTDGDGNQSFIFNTPFQLPLLYSRAALTGGTGTDNHPAWSPDGSKIAFTSNRSGVDNIWVVNADGAGLMQLTNVTGTDFSAKYPSWSPDGSKIAYIYHDPDPNPAEGAFDGYFLYTMNADGSGQTLHPLPPRSGRDSADQFWEFETKFTQWLDNDRVAFVSYGPEGGECKLYHYTLSTQAVTQIVPTPEEVNPGEIYRISWNAATSKLAYDRWPIGIQTINSDGTNYQVLDVPRATQIDTPAMPGWRPDGAKLAFVKDMYNVSNIGIFDMTTKTALVERTETDDEWPVWSPDGNTIAFVSNGKIWTMTIINPKLSVTGKVSNWQDTAPLGGVAVDLLGTGSPQSTTTDESGNFTITNITAGQSFYLRFRITGRADIYTGDLLFNGSAPVDLGSYVMPTDAEMAALGLTAGKGIIMGRVLDQQLGNGGRVSGAVVAATSSAHPAPGYTVAYRDPLGNLGGTATYGNGRYYVLNVDGGDVVTVTAMKGNRSPVSRTFHTFSASVNEGSIRPAAPGYDLSFAGTVSDTSGSPVGGAIVEIDGYPAIGVTTGTDGGYLLADLPRDVNMNLKITRDGYVPSYTGSFGLGDSMAGIPLTLFTQTDFTNMGVDSGRGLVAGRVVNDVFAPLAGAVVTVASSKGQTYAVNYGTGGGTATTTDGRFWMPDVLAGDVVTVSVVHSGYVFPGATYLQGYADAATTKLFIGTPAKGDINGDGLVNLADAILTLQTLAGSNTGGIRSAYPLSGADVNGDGKVGPHELLYILQYLAGARTGEAAASLAPYETDAATVLLDHFDGETQATIYAYSENGAACGAAKPAATPNFSYDAGNAGLNQALTLSPPAGQPAGSATYLQYPGGQLLSQPNGTIEFWVYLTSYGPGLSFVDQGPYYGSCAGWTFGMGVNAEGSLTASAWAAFDLNSGATKVPLNTWTHVAATWGSGGAKLYINGSLAGSSANTGMPASGYGGSVRIRVGSYNAAARIDELRISNVQR